MAKTPQRTWGAPFIVLSGDAITGQDATVGPGGVLPLEGGDAAAGSGGAGGNVTIKPGLPDGAGARGIVNITNNGGPDSAPVLQVTSQGANGEDYRTFVGTLNPNGVVSGNPGDLYVRHNAANSALYINRGTVDSNTTWVDLTPSSVAQPTLVVLGSNVANSTVAFADVTTLSFPVVAGETYWFSFTIPYNAVIATTGSRWAINGPVAPTQLNYTAEWTLAAGTKTLNSANAYDLPALASPTSLLLGNVATIVGIIRPSLSGTVTARFASEIAASAVTALAGATLFYMRVL